MKITKFACCLFIFYGLASWTALHGDEPDTAAPESQSKDSKISKHPTPSWLENFSKRFPKEGGSLQDLYSRHESRLAERPELREALQRIVSLMGEHYNVDRQYSVRPNSELERKQHDLHWQIRRAFKKMWRSGPEGREILKDLRSPAMSALYESIGLHFTPHRWRNMQRAFDLGREAERKLSDKDWNGAAQYATAALKLDGEDPETLLARANAFYQMGRYDQAHQDAVDALRLDRTNAAAFAMAKMTEGRSEFADRGSGDIPASQVNNHGTFSDVGSMPMSAKSPIVAPGLASPQADARVLQSNDHVRAATRAIQIKDYAAALQEADKAIELNPKNAQAYLYRAVANFKPGRYEETVKDANSGLKLLPNDRVLLNTKAFALNRLREFGLAKVAAEAAMAVDSNDPEAWYNLAYSEAGLGDHDGMLSALRRAAALNPERFEEMYQSAIQAPSAGDLSLLFEDERPRSALAASARRAAPNPSRAQNQFLLIALAALSGGFLIALGLLHVFLPRWAIPITGVFRRKQSDPRRSALASIRSPNGDRDLPVIAGNYQIIRQIGAGGMGKVYEAMDLSLARPVAIKKMREEIRDDPRERERFLREARLVAALRHPNIVEIHSILEEDQDVYLVFEYVDGDSLDRILTKRERLSFGEARTIIREVGKALNYAHERGVIHRDLKPSNVMVNYQESLVKVMDFGVARQTKDAVGKLTSTRTIIGTPPYMAPEAEQGVIRKESDIYSLGVCLYEILTGELPFVGSGAGMLMNKMKLNFQPPSRWIRGLPEGVDELLMRAIQPDPEKRIRSAGEFIQALESLVVSKK